MTFEDHGGELVFKSMQFQDDQDHPMIIKHDLTTLRIASFDTESQRFLCKSNRHYGLQIVSKSGYRKLYFMTYDKMLAGVDYIL